jgi:hypothetical protein
MEQRTSTKYTLDVEWVLFCQEYIVMDLSNLVRSKSRGATGINSITLTEGGRDYHNMNGDEIPFLGVSA